MINVKHTGFSAADTAAIALPPNSPAGIDRKTWELASSARASRGVIRQEKIVRRTGETPGSHNLFADPLFPSAGVIGGGPGADHHTPTHPDLVNFAGRCLKSGAAGIQVVAGGSEPVSPGLPLLRYLSAFAEIMGRFRLRIGVMTGQVDGEIARLIDQAKVDTTVLDLAVNIGATGCQNGTADDALDAVSGSSMTIIPRIIIGSARPDEAELKDFCSILARHDPAGVLVTPAIAPAGDIDIHSLTRQTASIAANITGIPLFLYAGAMPDEARESVETVAIAAGFAGIAEPARMPLLFAENAGIALARHEGLTFMNLARREY